MGSGLDSCLININNMFCCQEITFNICINMQVLHQCCLLVIINVLIITDCMLLNRSKTVLALRTISTHFDKKEKKEKKKMGTFTIHFQPVCVWSGLSFFCFPFYILVSHPTHPEQNKSSKAPPEPVLTPPNSPPPPQS